MTIIILLIAISLSIAVLFLMIFFWNIRSGQYDDTYTPSVRMLFEDGVAGEKRQVTTPLDRKNDTTSPGQQKVREIHAGNFNDERPAAETYIRFADRHIPSGRMLFPDEPAKNSGSPKSF